MIDVSRIKIMHIWGACRPYFQKKNLLCLQVRPWIWSFKYWYHLIPNQRYVCNERVGEWSNNFRVTSIQYKTADNRSTWDQFLTMVEILYAISVVCGITCGGWKFHIIPKSVTDRFTIYSTKYSDVFVHRFQGLGTFLWIYGRYNLWVLVCFFHVPLVINCV